MGLQCLLLAAGCLTVTLADLNDDGADDIVARTDERLVIVLTQPGVDERPWVTRGRRSKGVG